MRLFTAFAVMVVLTLGVGPTVAHAEQPSWLAYGAAYVQYEDDHHALSLSAVRYFDLPDFSATDDAQVSVGVGGECLARSEFGTCTLRSYYYACAPEGSEFGTYRLAHADEFVIDFHSLRSAELSQTTYVCLDPAATRVTVSVTWIGQGRLFLGPEATERFREIVTSRGTVAIEGGDTFSFEQTTELGAFLTSRYFPT